MYWTGTNCSKLIIAKYHLFKFNYLTNINKTTKNQSTQDANHHQNALILLF